MLSMQHIKYHKHIEINLMKHGIRASRAPVYSKTKTQKHVSNVFDVTLVPG